MWKGRFLIKLHPSVEFTVEMEMEGQLPFVGLLLKKKQKKVDLEQQKSDGHQTGYHQHFELCLSAQSCLFQLHDTSDANPSHFLGANDERDKADFQGCHTEYLFRTHHQQLD